MKKCALLTKCGELSKKLKNNNLIYKLYVVLYQVAHILTKMWNIYTAHETKKYFQDKDTYNQALSKDLLK